MADGADVDDGLVWSDAIDRIEFVGGAIRHVLGPDARHVRVADETEMLDLREDALHLVRIADVRGVDVLARRIGRGAVNQ